MTPLDVILYIRGELNEFQDLMKRETESIYLCYLRWKYGLRKRIMERGLLIHLDEFSYKTIYSNTTLSSDWFDEYLFLTQHYETLYVERLNRPVTPTSEDSDITDYEENFGSDFEVGNEGD